MTTRQIPTWRIGDATEPYDCPVCLYLHEKETPTVSHVASSARHQVCAESFRREAARQLQHNPRVRENKEVSCPLCRQVCSTADLPANVIAKVNCLALYLLSLPADPDVRPELVQSMPRDIIYLLEQPNAHQPPLENAESLILLNKDWLSRVFTNDPPLFKFLLNSGLTSGSSLKKHFPNVTPELIAGADAGFTQLRQRHGQTAQAARRQLQEELEKERRAFLLGFGGAALAIVGNADAFSEPGLAIFMGALGLGMCVCLAKKKYEDGVLNELDAAFAGFAVALLTTSGGQIVGSPLVGAVTGLTLMVAVDSLFALYNAF